MNSNQLISPPPRAHMQRAASKFVLACLAIIFAPACAFAQTLPTWPLVDGWGVELFVGANKLPFCMAISGGPPYGSADHHIIFAVNATSSTFYLTYTGQQIPPSPTIHLAVDGKPLVTLQDHEDSPPNDPGEHMLDADMPGAMLTQKIFPALAQGQTLNTQAGAHNYALSLAGFPKIVTDFHQCAQDAADILNH